MYFFFELIILFAIPDSTVATSITQTIMIVAETSYLGKLSGNLPWIVPCNSPQRGKNT